MKSLLTGLLTLCSAALARADDVLLTNGRTLVGIAHEESAQWVVRTRFGDFRIPKDEVQSVVPGRTALHEYDERIAEQYGCPCASEMFDLALWAQQEGLIRYVNRLLTRTLELDPDHPEARRLLGYVRYEGRWVTSSERSALRATLALTENCAPARRAKVQVRRTAPLETTPFTLGIPRTQSRPSCRYGGSGGYSIWQGVVPARNILNLPPLNRRGGR